MRDGTVIEVFANLGGAGEASSAVEHGRRRRRAAAHRVPVPRARRAALRGRAGADARRDRGRPRRPPADRAHARRRRRQAAAAVPMEPEANPFLGRRGLRLSLARPELFLVQLRAILRVAAEHPLKVMFPMVSTAAELDAALALLEQARAETGVRAELEAGIMVEVPAAALLAEQLAAARRVLLGRDQRPHAVHDGRRARQPSWSANCSTGPAGGAAPDPPDRRAARAPGAGSACAASWPATRPPPCCSSGSGVRELSMAPPLIAEVKEALRAIDLASDRRGRARRARRRSDAARAAPTPYCGRGPPGTIARCGGFERSRATDMRHRRRQRPDPRAGTSSRIVADAGGDGAGAARRHYTAAAIAVHRRLGDGLVRRLFRPPMGREHDGSARSWTPRPTSCWSPGC